MIEWLTESLNFWKLTWTSVLLGVGLFVVTFLGSIALVGFLIVNLPADYFCNFSWRDSQKGRPAWRFAALIGKNILLGALFIILGVILSLPGLPGQGILTILIGLGLVDFPGKRRLVRWMLSHPKVLETVNRLRQRHGKTPLIVEKSGL